VTPQRLNVTGEPQITKKGSRKKGKKIKKEKQKGGGIRSISKTIDPGWRRHLSGKESIKEQGKGGRSQRFSKLEQPAKRGQRTGVRSPRSPGNSINAGNPGLKQSVRNEEDFLKGRRGMGIEGGQRWGKGQAPSHINGVSTQGERRL